MEKLLKAISSVVPFLAPYPVWVKTIFAFWVAISALLVVALVLGRSDGVPITPDPSQPPNPAPDTAGRRSDAETWLVLQGMEFFAAMPGAQVQVTANVDGTEYTYPSIAGVEWLDVGPSMAPQTFRLPPTSDRYRVRFHAKVRVLADAGDVTATGDLTSVEEQFVDLADLPVSREYILHTFDPVHLSRGAEATASLKYTITHRPR